MTQPELFELMGRFEAGTCTRLEYEENGARLVLEKGAPYAAAPLPGPAAQYAPAPAAPLPQAEKQGKSIQTPLVGTFYAAPEPGKPAFVRAGDTVRKGQTVCIIEAMKMINEIPAPCDCVIEKVLLEDGALAGYGEALFLIREL